MIGNTEPRTSVHIQHINPDNLDSSRDIWIGMNAPASEAVDWAVSIVPDDRLIEHIEVTQNE